MSNSLEYSRMYCITCWHSSTMSSAAVEVSCLASEAFSSHTDTKTCGNISSAKINLYCMLNTACKISDMLTDLTSLLLHKTWRSKGAISVGRCWPVLLSHFLLSGSRWHKDPVWSGCKNYPEVTLLYCAHRNKTETKHPLEHCTWHTQVQFNWGSSRVCKIHTVAPFVSMNALYL